MMEKGKRQQRQSAEDATFNKMLIWLAGAIVSEVLILLVKRFYIEFTLTDASIAIASGLSAFFKVFQFVGLVLAVLGVAWTVLTLKQRKKARLQVACTAVVLVLWIIAIFAYHLYDTGVRILMVLPAVAAVLIVIYFLYQKAFFINAILTGGGMAALWLYRQYYMNHPTAVTVCFVGGWVVLALVAALTVRLRRNDGQLGSVRLLPEKSSYIMVYVTCGVTAAAMLAGLLLGSGVAFYATLVLVGWLFCQAVYYTVKLM